MIEAVVAERALNCDVILTTYTCADLAAWATIYAEDFMLEISVREIPGVHRPGHGQTDGAS